MEGIQLNKPQQARSEETRAHILETALELFAQSGYDSTGVAEICERSGVSKGALYHHFPTKQAIFIELLEQWLSGLEKELTEAGSSASNVPEALHRMAERMQGVLQLADGRISIFLEFWAQARKDPKIWERTIKPFRHYRRIFELLIKKGIQEGSFTAVEPEPTAHALVSLAVGLLLQGVVDPEGAKWEDVTVKAIDNFIEAMRRRNS